MTVVYDALVDAHDADEFPISVAYSRDVLNKDAISAEVKTKGIVRYLVSAPLPMRNDLRNSTLGDVKVIQPWMLVFASTGKKCVKGLEDWFKRVGCVMQTGIVGVPPNGPWTYSTLSLLSYTPIGDLEQFAEPYGDVYCIEQYARISIA